eukprot:1216455-Amphidinium_carterae.2
MAHTRGQARRLLPLAGYSTGVSGVPWAQAWVDARRRQGLCASPDVPTMPVPRGITSERHPGWS